MPAFTLRTLITPYQEKLRTGDHRTTGLWLMGELGLKMGVTGFQQGWIQIPALRYPLVPKGTRRGTYSF